MSILVGCGAPMIAPSVTELELEQRHNYTWTGSVAVADAEVAAGTDLSVDWSALTVDVAGRGFDGVVDQVLLYRIEASRQNFLDQLIRDEGSHEIGIDGAVYAEPAAGDRSLQISELGLQGWELDPANLVEDPTADWLLMWLDVVPRAEVRAMTWLTPRAASTTTLVSVADGDSVVTSTVDLHTAPPLVATAGRADYLLDWSGLTADTHGNPFRVDTMAREVVVARFDVATVADVELLFDRLDVEAAEVYRLPVEDGTTEASLNQAVDDAGVAFGGFTTAGVWLVGLERVDWFGPLAAAAIVDVN